MKKLKHFLSNTNQVLLVFGLCILMACNNDTTSQNKENKESKESRISEGDYNVDKVPDILLYPGAKAVGSSSGSEEELPGISLATTDDPQKVHDFYEQNLKGWKYDERYEIFWKGEGDKYSFDKMMSTPSISIRESSKVSAVIPNEKSVIGIFYAPKE